MSVTRFQGIITALATSAAVDIRFPGARVVYAQPGYGRLCIESLAVNQLMVVQRWDDDENDGIDSPCIVLYMGTREWTPLRLSARFGSIDVGEIDETGRVVVIKREDAARSLASLCDEWCDCLVTGGWITGATTAASDRGDEALVEQSLHTVLAGLNIPVESA